MGIDSPRADSDRPREPADRLREPGNLFGSQGWDVWRPNTPESRARDLKIARGELRTRYNGETGRNELVECEPYDWAKRADRIKEMREVQLPEAVRDLPLVRDRFDLDCPAQIDKGKFFHYLLDPDHPRGREKAPAFEAAGYKIRTVPDRANSSQELIEVTRAILPEGRVAGVQDSDYGRKFRAVNGFIGPSGRHATYETCWIIEGAPGRQYPRLVTGWLALHKDKDQDERD